MQICLATSLATIAVTSLRSLLGHHRKGAVDWDILKGWAPGIGIGAVLGVVAASGLRGEVLMVIFAVLGMIVGLYLAFGRADWRLGDAMPTGIGRAVTSPTLGFLSVLMGIGGGSFGVPLMSLYGVAIHRAVATAAGFGLVIAVPLGRGVPAGARHDRQPPALHPGPGQSRGLRGGRGHDADHDAMGRAVAMATDAGRLKASSPVSSCHGR